MGAMVFWATPFFRLTRKAENLKFLFFIRFRCASCLNMGILIRERRWKVFHSVWNIFFTEKIKTHDFPMILTSLRQQHMYEWKKQKDRTNRFDFSRSLVIMTGGRVCCSVKSLSMVGRVQSVWSVGKAWKGAMCFLRKEALNSTECPLTPVL